MKKTSLLLAIGALLYGASGNYAFANEEMSLYSGMPEESVIAILDQVVIPKLTEIPENAPEENIPSGLEDPSKPSPNAGAALPSNVGVAVTPGTTPNFTGGLINSKEVKVQHMCPESFPVDGAKMAKFPVTVTLGNGTTVTSTWTQVYSNGGQATVGYIVGNGWLLAQRYDTWNVPWILYTQGNVSIKQIVLEPLKRYPKSDKRVYAFDIGGKLPSAPSIGNQHTIGAERGQFIVRSPSSPNVAFQAIYSDPVYLPLSPPTLLTPNVHTGAAHDGNVAIPLGGSGNRVPKHDLYGTLTIGFSTPVQGVSTLNNIAFAFVADTDCVLPVREVGINSYNGTTLNFTVVGEGAVAIMENAQKVVQGPFVVDRGDGEGTFTTQFIPQAGSCYVMTDIDTGTVMTDKYCF